MEIASMPKTKIYIDEQGSICIEQESMHGDADAVVYFPREMAKTITDEILRLAAEANPTG